MPQSRTKTVWKLFDLPDPPKTGRARLLAAAVELFYRHGFAAVGIDQVITLARLPGRAAPAGDDHPHLRPLERCVLGWRSRGASHAEIAPRFRRSEAFVARVEEFAHYKLSLE